MKRPRNLDLVGARKRAAGAHGGSPRVRRRRERQAERRRLVTQRLMGQGE